jgi:tetratricopeptide (TPR) repeat protein
MKALGSPNFHAPPALRSEAGGRGGGVRLALALLPMLLCVQGVRAQSNKPAPVGDLAAGIAAARATDYPRAEKVLGAIRGADQPAAEAALAQVLFEQGRFADADRVAQHAAAMSAQMGRATVVRARALAARGRTSEALQLLEPLKDAPGRAGRDVRLLLGELLIGSGHRQDAEVPLLKIIDEYNTDAIKAPDAESLAIVGRAAFLLRSPKDANRAFNESERIDKSAPQMLLWRAELFLDKYDPGHAEEALKEALKTAPNRADALVLYARVKLDQTLDFDAADKLVKDALAIDPNLSSAYAVRASIALRDMDLAASEAAIAAGLAINPNDTQLWSLRAATRFLGDDRPGFEAAKKEALSRNPELAGVYETVGDFAEWEHRYTDIVTMMKQATQLDPKDGKAFAELGLTELRNGDETEGLEALRKAWSLDHFNVRVFNTLNLYEQAIPNDYETGKEGVFAIRYPKAERKVLERYVPKMLAEAWGSMKARYDFVPSTPVGVELYANRDQFSVRTSGLPNIGIEGVCFGQVVAAMSPKAEPFNWGNVLWHELGHVFAIQLSKSHVPRWFTEGLSEYETIIRRPEWQRELDPELYMAIVARRLPGAADMNRAFTHADNGEDMTVAYYASSQMLVFTAEQFGMPKIVKALKLWGDGLRTPAVIEKAFGLSPADYDAKYRAWELARLSRYSGQFLFDEHAPPLDVAKAKVAATPTDAAAHAAYALALLHAKKLDLAKPEIDEALRLDPKQLTARFLAVKIAFTSHDAGAVQTHLDAMRQAGADGYTLQMALAELAKVKQDKPGLRAALEAAAKFDPSQSDPLKALFALDSEDKLDADALDVLRKLTRLEQHDRKAWHALLDKLVAAKKWDEAAAVGESAVFVDVESASIHVGYARALSALKRHPKAVFELESALACDPPPKEAAEVHALLAAELVATHDVAGAKAQKEAALKLDPENATARGLVVP